MSNNNTNSNINTDSNSNSSNNRINSDSNASGVWLYHRGTGVQRELLMKFSPPIESDNKELTAEGWEFTEYVSIDNESNATTADISSSSPILTQEINQQAPMTALTTVNIGRECPICGHSKGAGDFILLSCGHNNICNDCIVNAYRSRNRKCPICRHLITHGEISHLLE
jgi:hypothetical protein